MANGTEFAEDGPCVWFKFNLKLHTTETHQLGLEKARGTRYTNHDIPVVSVDPRGQIEE